MSPVNNELTVGLVQAQEVNQLIQNYTDLKHLGLHIQADAVKGKINNLIGANPQVTPATETNAQAIAEDNDVYIVFNGARGTGKTLLSEMVNKSLSQFGLTVEGIEGQEDTLRVVNPQGNKNAPLCARHERIHELMQELQKLGVAVFPA